VVDILLGGVGYWFVFEGVSELLFFMARILILLRKLLVLMLTIMLLVEYYTLK
jgi:hypothetical protein